MSLAMSGMAGHDAAQGGCTPNPSTTIDMVKCCMQRSTVSVSTEFAACNLSSHVCPPLPPAAVQRAVSLRSGDWPGRNSSAAAAMAHLAWTLRSAARPLRVAAIGGSVTAGHLGRSWLDYMRDDLFPKVWDSDSNSRGRVSFSKLATNAMGPAYMARCLPRHASSFGGTLPDLVIAEYAVTDLDAMSGREPAHMEELARTLSAHGVVLVLLHHFAPAFIVGGKPYFGHRSTGEPAHEKLAENWGLTSASLRNASGLPSAWARANQAALRPCSFACAFSADNHHPTACGQRYLAQIATSALTRVLRAAADRSMALAVEGGSPAAPPQLAAPVHTKCWSVIGSTDAERNLLPSPAANASGWRLLNLKGHEHGMSNVMAAVYKLVFIAQAADARIEFENITCSADERLRVFHIAGETMQLGRARVEIDGQPAVTTKGLDHMSGYWQSQGAIFVSTDFVIPTRKRMHTIAVVTLNESDNPAARNADQLTHRFGFAINALICVPPEPDNAVTTHAPHLDRRRRLSSDSISVKELERHIHTHRRRVGPKDRQE